MSLREEIMERFEDFVSMNGLTRVYSGSGLSKDKKFRYVLFNTPRTLDGEVRIYGPKFIGIKFQTAYRAFPRDNWVVFRNVDDALDFLDQAFVKHNTNKALEMINANTK